MDYLALFIVKLGTGMSFRFSNELFVVVFKKYCVETRHRPAARLRRERGVAVALFKNSDNLIGQDFHLDFLILHNSYVFLISKI